MGIHAKAAGILSHQRYFLYAPAGQVPNFRQHAFNSAGAEAAPNQGNGAVGAAVVTAVGNTHIGAVGRGGQHPAALQHRVGPVAVAGALAAQGLLDGLGQPGIFAYAHKQVDFRHFFL